jgi:hypothetical protein
MMGGFEWMGMEGDGIGETYSVIDDRDNCIEG